MGAFHFSWKVSEKWVWGGVRPPTPIFRESLNSFETHPKAIYGLFCLALLLPACILARGAQDFDQREETKHSPTLAVSPVLSPTNQDAYQELDIPYSEIGGSDPNLTSLDIYTPHSKGDPSNKSPILLYVHGGGWRTGDKHNVRNKPGAFNARGYIFISTNYRLAPEVDVPTQAGDIASAIAWAHTHAASLGGDPDGITLMGHSAGAHLVSLVAANPTYLEAEGFSLDIIKAVVALDTQAYDIPQLMENVSRIGGRTYQEAFGTDPDFWALISPIAYIVEGAGIPPFIVAYSGYKESRKNQAEQFVHKLLNPGIRAELDPAGEKTHTEINREFGAPGDAVTDAVFAFLAKISQ